MKNFKVFFKKIITQSLSKTKKKCYKWIMTWSKYLSFYLKKNSLNFVRFPCFSFFYVVFFAGKVTHFTGYLNDMKNSRLFSSKTFISSVSSYSVLNRWGVKGPLTRTFSNNISNTYKLVHSYHVNICHKTAEISGKSFEIAHS